MKTKLWTIILVMLLSGCHAAPVVVSDVPVDVASIPSEFTSFKLGEHSEETELLNHFLWYHYKTRLSISQAAFSLEYITISDMWLAGAIHPSWADKAPVQDLHRKNLLKFKMNPDGYINTHQHYSHSHEQAWPFPVWPQGNPASPQGGAAGWHFNLKSDNSLIWAFALNHMPDTRFAREKSIEGWKLENVESLGFVNNKWKLKTTGKSPSLTIPEDIIIDAFNAPYLQLRWNRSPKAPTGILPYVEWKGEDDKDYSQTRRVYFDYSSGNPEYEKISKTRHSMMAMYEHPEWKGSIKNVRIVLAPNEENVDFEIDSFFTVYDTRQTINNPLYIFACWNYFRWTGDIDFLKSRINQIRKALLFQQTVLGGLKYNHIRNTMPGHDGRAGFTLHPDKERTINYGHGIGGNYWDITAFGWDDFSAANQYYASTILMAEIEEAIKDNPQWGISPGCLVFDPETLRNHAAEVKRTANSKFWNEKDGRFIACIDKNGEKHDYGFTIVNLESIWYGIANQKHTEKIMDWITGKRIVETDTSQGEDIYKWRFGPRSTTLRNIEWYQFCWTHPENFPWGGQVQDGGAVLGFSFYDLWARLHVISADNAWQRLTEILEWEKDVWAQGGYRNFYKDGKQGTTLQGGGTAGGLGVDFEFYESSLIPSIVTYGFLGIDPKANSLKISPNLPDGCPDMSVQNLLYRNVRMDITATNKTISIILKDEPISSINLSFSKDYKNTDTKETAAAFKLATAGTYNFSCE